MPRFSGAPRLSLASGGVGGLLLMFSATLPWSSSGAGSALALRRVGDLVLSGTVDAWVPRSLGVAVYLVPFGGALVLVGTGLPHRLAPLVSAAGLLAAVVGAMVIFGALDRMNRSGLGEGALFAGVGTGLGMLSLTLRLPLVRSRAARPHPVPPTPPDPIVEVHR